jgi:broad specificity phosphatase PhoE
MRIFLIRHGESQANVDKNLHKIIPDHEIALSSRGFQQAEQAGEILKAFFEKDYADMLNPEVANKDKAKKYLDNMLDVQRDTLLGSHVARDSVAKLMGGLLEQFGENIPVPTPQIKLWHSPYRRTRETVSVVKKSLDGMLKDTVEDVLLAEQQFGLFDGLNEDEQSAKFPNEYIHFEHVKKYNGKFWARFPMGESAFDVVCRLRQFFQQLKQDEEDGIQDTVIVCHGTILRLFTMAWLNLTPEWFQGEAGPGNCAIRILNTNKDEGYLFGGYRDGRAWDYKGNTVGK